MLDGEDPQAFLSPYRVKVYVRDNKTDLTLTQFIPKYNTTMLFVKQVAPCVTVYGNVLLPRIRKIKNKSL